MSVSVSFCSGGLTLFLWFLVLGPRNLVLRSSCLSNVCLSCRVNAPSALAPLMRLSCVSAQLCWMIADDDDDDWSLVGGCPFCCLPDAFWVAGSFCWLLSLAFTPSCHDGRGRRCIHVVWYLQTGATNALTCF